MGILSSLVNVTRARDHKRMRAGLSFDDERETNSSLVTVAHSERVFRLLRWFGTRTTKQYFACRQFDVISGIVGVKLAAHHRYCIESHVSSKALADLRKGTIRFDNKWFLGLSPSARCALVVHEIWHIAMREKAARARRLRPVYSFVVLPLISLVVTSLFLVLASALIGDGKSLSGVPVFLYPVLVVTGYLFRNRLFNWPLEYESDGAAVRFMGLDATKGFLGTLSLKSTFTSHPPTMKRLEHADRVALSHPTPIVDFADLQKRTPQKFVPVR